MGTIFFMYVIFGNYGNSTIAAVQWAKQNKLSDVYVVSVNTNWEAENWRHRVQLSEQFASKCGFSVVRLNSKPPFQTLMQDRGNFPSTKFQWCAGFLKGLPFLDWLDEQDASAEAVIILGKRRLDSPINFTLEEYIEESEHYGDRKIWYPLYKHTNDEYRKLLLKAGLPILNTRSLECDPCVNSYGNDLARLRDSDIIKTRELEESVGCHMFSMPIEKMVQQARKHKQDSTHMFDMGCGAPFGCGE